MDNQLREQATRGTPLYPLQLYQMTSGQEGIFVPYHWHSEIEVLFILQGTLSLTVNEKKFSGTKGDIFWIGQEALHGMHTEDRHTRYAALVFPVEFLNFEMFDYVQSFCLNPLCHKEKSFPTQIPKQSRHYQRAWRELLEIYALDEERAEGFQILIKAALLKLIGLLVREGLLQSVRGGEERLSDFKMKNLKRILTYIKEHYNEKISLSQIAREFNLSPKYFSRYFKNNLDRSFVEYLNGFRIERAIDLLVSTDLPVGQIALEVGFDNFSYFIGCFKRVHGCTPSRYRKQVHSSSVYRHADF